MNDHITTQLDITRLDLTQDKTYNYYINNYIYEMARGGDHRLNKILLTTITTQWQQRKTKKNHNLQLRFMKNKAPRTQPKSKKELT